MGYDRSKQPSKAFLIGFVVVMVLLIGIAVHATSGSSPIAPVVSDSSTSDNSSSGSSSVPVSTGPTIHGMNEPVVDGNMQVVVTAFKCGQHYLVNDNQFEDATAQGQFCVLSLSLKDVGAVPVTFEYAAQYLYDASTNMYSASSAATEAANPSGSDCWSYASLNPGVSMSCNVAFDVPVGFQADGASLHDGVADSSGAGALVKL